MIVCCFWVFYVTDEKIDELQALHTEMVTDGTVFALEQKMKKMAGLNVNMCDNGSEGFDGVG